MVAGPVTTTDAASNVALVLANYPNRDGRIGQYQQQGVQREDNRTSRRIWSQKHDQQHRH